MFVVSFLFVGWKFLHHDCCCGCWQDPAMSGMLSNLTNPSHREQIEQQMAQVREDPTLKPVLEEIESGGPAAMMK